MGASRTPETHVWKTADRKETRPHPWFPTPHEGLSVKKRHRSWRGLTTVPPDTPILGPRRPAATGTSRGPPAHLRRARGPEPGQQPKHGHEAQGAPHHSEPAALDAPRRLRGDAGPAAHGGLAVGCRVAGAARAGPGRWGARGGGGGSGYSGGRGGACGGRAAGSRSSHAAWQLAPRAPRETGPAARAPPAGRGGREGQRRRPRGRGTARWTWPGNSGATFPATGGGRAWPAGAQPAEEGGCSEGRGNE